VNQQQQDDLRECVKRGVNLIDQYGPQDWRKKINLAKLDMCSVTNCVLGQLYETFTDGLKALNFRTRVRGDLKDENDEWQKVCDNGFAVVRRRALVDTNVLTNLWHEEIGGANVGVPSVEHTPL
jgi:hypothetical protein